MGSSELLEAKERLEASIIGCLIFNPELTYIALQRLPPECFRYEERAAFEIINKLYDENNLTEAMLASVMVNCNLNLHKYDRIGMAYDKKSLEFECERLMDIYVALELEKETQEAVSRAMEHGYGIEETGDLIKKLEELMSLRDNFYPDRTLAECLPEYLSQIEEESLKPIEDDSLWFKKLHHFNSTTNGLKKENLVVVAGAWKVGKTTLALEMACDLAISSHCKVGYMSYEVSHKELMNKIMSSKLHIPYEHLRQPQKLTDTEKKKLKGAKALMQDTKIYLRTGRMNDEEVKSKMRSLVKRHGVECIFIDYVNLIKPVKKLHSREEEVSEISKMLKTMATELNVCIVALTQMNRASVKEKRASGENLSESVALVRDCDYLFCIERPADKGIKTITYEGKSYSTDNIFDIGLDASRHSKQGVKFPLMLVEGELLELDQIKDNLFDN